MITERGTACRAAGDVVQAIAAGHLSPQYLVTLGAIVNGTTAVDSSRTRVFKSVGMAWEDVVVAVRVLQHSTGKGR